MNQIEAVFMNKTFYPLELAEKNIKEIHFIREYAKYVLVTLPENETLADLNKKPLSEVIFEEAPIKEVNFQNKKYYLLDRPRRVNTETESLIYMAAAIDEELEEAYLVWELNYFGCLDLVNGNPPYDINKPSKVHYL